jgi:hypothetical protein
MASQFDVDDEQELNLFQEHFPHLAAPPTESELEEVRRYLDICSRMKKGWLAEAIRKLDAKKVERAKQMEQYNPFEDVPQYGKKATAEKVPRFSDFPFSKRLRADDTPAILSMVLTFGRNRKGTLPERALGRDRSQGRERQPGRTQEDPQNQHQVHARQACRL